MEPDEIVGESILVSFLEQELVEIKVTTLIITINGITSKKDNFFIVMVFRN
jgi:hypothetical protein